MNHRHNVTTFGCNKFIEEIFEKQKQKQKNLKTAGSKSVVCHTSISRLTKLIIIIKLFQKKQEIPFILLFLLIKQMKKTQQR